MNEETNTLRADFPGEAKRADQVLAEANPGLSRSQLKQRLASLKINGKTAKISAPVRAGDVLEYFLLPPEIAELEAEKIDLDILYEDEDVLVVNKASGLVVHPAAGNQRGTLVQGLLYHVENLKDQDFEDDSRPGIVHRLDKDTSGVLICAKRPSAHEFLSAQFQERSTQKYYLAVAYGSLKQESFSLGGFLRRDPRNRQRFGYDSAVGKAAYTEFRCLFSRQSCHLLLVKPRSGRTHQIRVHASHLGLPLLGDPLYPPPRSAPKAERLLLHAFVLGIRLPGKDEPVFFRAPPPESFLKETEKLGLNPGFDKIREPLGAFFPPD